MLNIHQNVRAGNVIAVAQQLKQGVGVDDRNDNDQTPLMVAVASEKAGTEMIRLLIEYGADVNVVENQDHNTVLAMAIRQGTLEKVELLIEAGAIVHYQRKGGYDALIDALHSRFTIQQEPLLPLIEMLLAHGVTTRGESDWGESALSVSSHIGRFDVVSRLLQSGADSQVLEWTELMHDIALGTITDIETTLNSEPDLAAQDRWERTPWLLSLETGDLAKVKLLYSTGADINERGHCGQTALMYAIGKSRSAVLSFLIAHSAELDAKDDFGDTALMKAAEEGDTESVRLLLQATANLNITNKSETKVLDAKAVLEEFGSELEDNIDPGLLDFGNLPGETAISKASNLDIVRLLVAAGADLGDISDEMRAELTHLETEGEITCSPREYLEGKHRRFGISNPEIMEYEFWKAMVRSGTSSAYAARAAYDDAENYGDGAVWCFQRFGKSITELPDGRIIEIGGEHEDFYDPDFCIYNDVFVHYGGGRFDILSYPETVFPPTDFHSATLVGEVIYIIGCLGYPEARRSGETPVYCLDCRTLAIEKITTTGDNPGWIYGHKAICKPNNQGDVLCLSGGKIIQIVDDEEEYLDNSDTYFLNLTTMAWSRGQNY